MKKKKETLNEDGVEDKLEWKTSPAVVKLQKYFQGGGGEYLERRMIMEQPISWMKGEEWWRW
jgi:hypothetical protein